MKKIIALTLIILGFISSPTISQQALHKTPEEINSEFFMLYKTKGMESSIDFLFQGSKWVSKETIDTLKVRIKNLTNQLGSFYGSDFITKKSIGSNYILYSFLIKYDRMPIRFTLTYYRPNVHWQIQLFEFDYELQQELREAANLYRMEENLPGNNSNKGN